MNEQENLRESEKELISQVVLEQLENQLDEKFQEWKEFTFRDRTLDTIIAFTLGMAFSKLATAFSECLIMPIIKFLCNFTGHSWREIIWAPIPNLSFEVGKLLSATVDFILMSVVLFVMWKILRHFLKQEAAEAEEKKIRKNSPIVRQ
jgi:large conductance mechanosensitive channel